MNKKQREERDFVNGLIDQNKFDEAKRYMEFCSLLDKLSSGDGFIMFLIAMIVFLSIICSLRVLQVINDVFDLGWFA